jgi:hypothetical protein
MDRNKYDYWELQKYQDKTFTIQWTPQEGGMVRAKLDGIASWWHISCNNPFEAEHIGLHIIRQQKKNRQTNEFLLYDYEPKYQGA